MKIGVEMKGGFMLRIVLVAVSMCAADGVGIWGAGTASCGKVVSEKVEHRGKMHLDWPTGQWVLGYLSATVAIAPKLDPYLSTLDSDAITAFITKNCEENPLATLKDATIALIRAKITLGMEKSKSELPPPFK